MSKIVFFSMPAHGHTNPTLPVIVELTNRGHQVWYYSFLEFQKKIEDAGAAFIACDEFLPQVSQKELDRKVGKDFSALIEMIVDTTIAMDQKVLEQLKEIQPDCILYDSLSLWGRLFAKKLGVKYICSTTSFAFNKQTSKLMKRGITEIWKVIVGMPKMNRKVKQLQNHGYQVKNFISIVENDNQTDTIVYTSKEFQPMADTFSDKYHFVGPSIKQLPEANKDQKAQQMIYISLGTILNQNRDFYQLLIQAFKNTPYHVVMSVGDRTEITSLGEIPENFSVKKTVNQIAVLQTADVFITHCGMNSVNESLYFEVPMILFPQHSEQKLVADQAAKLGAGLKLESEKPKALITAVEEVMKNPIYKENAIKLSKSLQDAGGAKKAADVILANMNEYQ